MYKKKEGRGMPEKRTDGIETLDLVNIKLMKLYFQKREYCSTLALAP